MNHRGLVKGRTIEFEQPLPFPEGQSVSVTVYPVTREDLPGSPAYARKVMHETPHLESGDIEEFNEVLRTSELPIEGEELFDEDRLE